MGMVLKAIDRLGLADNTFVIYMSKLQKLLDRYLTDINAQRPRSNPQYDPSKPPSSRKGRGGRRKRR